MPEDAKIRFAEAGCMITDNEAATIFLEIDGRQDVFIQVINSLNENLIELISVIESLQSAWAANS
jgi:hypothetical protein